MASDIKEKIKYVLGTPTWLITRPLTIIPEPTPRPQ